MKVWSPNGKPSGKKKKKKILNTARPELDTLKEGGKKVSQKNSTANRFNLAGEIKKFH